VSGGVPRKDGPCMSGPEEQESQKIVHFVAPAIVEEIEGRAT
jgi:hypothetical protein